MGKVSIRFNEKEENEIKRKAQNLKMNVSEYIKKKIFRDIDDDDLFNFVAKQSDFNEKILELMANIFYETSQTRIQARMGNRLNGEILYKLDPKDANEILKEVKEKYLNSDRGAD